MLAIRAQCAMASCHRRRRIFRRTNTMDPPGDFCLFLRFCASPLATKAGGILTGKHSFDEPPEGGRFSSKTVWGGRYRRGGGASCGLWCFGILSLVSPSNSQLFSQRFAAAWVAAAAMVPIVGFGPGSVSIFSENLVTRNLYGTK